ncbi:hypothetical protein [Spiroplasma endosymbiont of Aspidapion aeneum]|uniref:hypothetical protein n=1 Tax=Spiroplasma endosymbiont of Aspidapion aeneum TaxID=3066276 RepID=UPI00313E9068
MNLNKKEIDFLINFKANFKEHSLWSQNKVINHYKLSKAFIYNLLNKLGFKKWKEFLFSINIADTTSPIKAEIKHAVNIEKFVDILKHKKLFITGEGYSKISGYEFLYFINNFKNDCKLVEIKRDWTWKFLDEKMSNSLFLVYSSKGKNINILNFLKYVSSLENNIVFCITDNISNIYKDYVNFFIYSNIDFINPLYYINTSLSPIIPQIYINHEIKKAFLSKK